MLVGLYLQPIFMSVGLNCCNKWTQTLLSQHNPSCSHKSFWTAVQKGRVILFHVIQGPRLLLPHGSVALQGIVHPVDGRRKRWLDHIWETFWSGLQVRHLTSSHVPLAKTQPRDTSSQQEKLENGSSCVPGRSGERSLLSSYHTSID